MLSAFFLLLAVLLAGGSEPLMAQPASTSAAQSSPTGLVSGSHRSIPFVSEQQMLAGEARDLEAVSWRDGKPKTFLPATGVEAAAVAVGVGQAPQAAAFVASAPASPYDARAPPAIS